MIITQFNGSAIKALQKINAVNLSMFSKIASLCCLLMLTNSSSAAAPITGLDHPDRIPGQYIVVMKSDLAGAQSTSAATQVKATSKGFNINYQFQHALKGFTIKAPDALGQAVSDSVLSDLANDPQVAFIEADRRVHLQGVETPLGIEEWGLDRIDQRALPLDRSYTFKATGANVNVYVVDSGLNAAHQEFIGRVGNGVDFIGDGRGTDDCVGHGTHVAGTIGGTRFGVAKGVTIHPVRVLGCDNAGSWSGIIAGIDWVVANRQGPSVINMSIGGDFSAAVDQAVSNAVGTGVVIVVAAGNNNQDACLFSPASTSVAITVAAVDNNDQRASFSNFGNCIDVFAPGVNITSSFIPTPQDTTTMSGTSMASPHVAGVAALFLEKNPTATPAQVSIAITSRASKNVVLNPGLNTPNQLLFNDLDTAPASSFVRTVVFIEGQTQNGQDMFIRGGIDHGFAKSSLGLDCTAANKLCAIPIHHLNFRNATTAPWKPNDNFLDWYGAEPNQSTAAQGSPLDWTTNLWPSSWGPKRTVAVDGFGETPMNKWGPHYWMFEVEMDCSKTVSGWFEFKSFISNGPGWEGNVSQPGAPYTSVNHFAQCGKLNVFKRGQNNPVTITNL